jgi:hypothetical protein
MWVSFSDTYLEHNYVGHTAGRVSGRPDWGDCGHEHEETYPVRGYPGMTDLVERVAEAVATTIHVDGAHGFPAGYGAPELTAELLAALSEAGLAIVREPAQGNRLIEVSPEVIDQWTSRTDDGRRVTVAWGEPDGGVYTPTFTVHEDGRLGELDAAWAAAEAALPEDTSLYLARNSAGKWGAQIRGARRTGAGGPTPAAALRTLAAKLEPTDD